MRVAKVGAARQGKNCFIAEAILWTAPQNLYPIDVELGILSLLGHHVRRILDTGPGRKGQSVRSLEDRVGESPLTRQWPQMTPAKWVQAIEDQKA
jgi:hypothetical protein